jgi:predicted amidohydrolase YtcJ
VNNAYAEGEEDRKGQVKVGMLGDIVVLEHDLFAIQPDSLKDVRTLLTVVGGRVVHAAAPFAR